MSIRDFLVNDLNATHLFTLDNETSDVSGVKSSDPTNITGGSYSFEPLPICEGFSESLRSSNSTNFTSRADGAIIDNRNDINGSNGGGNDSSSTSDFNTSSKDIHLWFDGLHVEYISLSRNLTTTFNFKCLENTKLCLVAKDKFHIVHKV